MKKLHHSEFRSFKWMGLIGLLFIIIGFVFFRPDIQIKTEGIISHYNETLVFSPADLKVENIFFRETEAVMTGEPIISLDRSFLDIELLSLESDALENLLKISTIEMLLDKEILRPSERATIRSEEKKKIREDINASQKRITETMEKLKKSGASSNNELERSKIEEMKTKLELIEVEIENEWASKNIADIDKNKLKNEIIIRKRNNDFIEAKKKILKEKISNCSIKSPCDGKITYLKVKHNGELLKEGTVVAKIAKNDNGRWMLKAFIDDKNIHLIKVGTKAKIELKSVDSYLKDEFNGMVVFVSPDSIKNLPESLKETPQYEVDVVFDSKDPRITPGISTNLRLLPGRRSLFDIIYGGGGI